MIQRYRRKPIEVEAVKWDGRQETYEFLRDVWMKSYCSLYEKETGDLLIETLEGLMRVNVGTFIIKGIEGEFYPCRSQIFEKIYEKVEE